MSPRPKRHERILPILRRRVNRVRDRIAEDDPGDAIMDDVFVVWRAFESTFELGTGLGNRQATIAAVKQVVSRFGLDELPALWSYIESLRHFEGAPHNELAQWFEGDGRGDPVSLDGIQDDCHVLQRTLEPSVRWTGSHGYKLASIIYHNRCAVVHPNLQTTNRLVMEVLPTLRQALIELTIARWAFIADATLAEAQHSFEEER